MTRFYPLGEMIYIPDKRYPGTSDKGSVMFRPTQNIMAYTPLSLCYMIYSLLDSKEKQGSDLKKL
jgi:hypothetical protein